MAVLCGMSTIQYSSTLVRRVEMFQPSLICVSFTTGHFCKRKLFST